VTVQRVRRQLQIIIIIMIIIIILAHQHKAAGRKTRLDIHIIIIIKDIYIAQVRKGHKCPDSTRRLGLTSVRTETHVDCVGILSSL